MLKKIIPIVLSLCLIFSISVMAENENTIVEDSAPEMSERIPQNAEDVSQGSENMGMPPSGNMQGRTPTNMPNGEMPREGMNSVQRTSGNFTPPQSNDVNNNTAETVPQTDGSASEENLQAPDGNRQFGGQMPGGMGGFPGDMQNNQQSQEETPMTFSGFVKTYSTPITSVILLVLAFIFVIFYRRKNY